MGVSTFGELRRLAVAVRKRLPARARRVLRAADAMLNPGTPSPRLPRALVGDCRFFASRREMIEHLPAGGEIAEIGTDRGKFARSILASAKPRRLHLFDLDFSALLREVADDRRVVLHQGASPAALDVLSDGSMSWIYVDGDHGYRSVVADAEAAAPKVEPGGYLVFNDFAHADPFLGRYGVHRAVVEFALAHSWPLAMFAYEPNALYDVALRKPGAFRGDVKTVSRSRSATRQELDETGT